MGTRIPLRRRWRSPACTTGRRTPGTRRHRCRAASRTDSPSARDSGTPVSVGLPKLSLLAEARHIPSPSDGVSQGPLLLTVDDATPDCLHLTAPGVEAVALAVVGTPGCPPRVEVGRDGEDQGGWFVAPDTAAAARSVLSAGGWCSVLAITWHVANLCI